MRKQKRGRPALRLKYFRRNLIAARRCWQKETSRRSNRQVRQLHRREKYLNRPCSELKAQQLSPGNGRYGDDDELNANFTWQCGELWSRPDSLPSRAWVA